MLKICLVSNNFDIAKEPVMNDPVDVACNLEFTVKKRDRFFCFTMHVFSFSFILVKELIIYKIAILFLLLRFHSPTKFNERELTTENMSLLS